MEIILTELFKKMVELFSERLGQSVFKTRKQTARSTLLDLHAQIMELKELINLLISVFDLLIDKPEDFHRADHQLNVILPAVRRVLATIVLDLRILAPEFAIMAEETVPAIEDLRHQEELLIDKLGLLHRSLPSGPPFQESLTDYQERLRSIRQQAETAKNHLAAFIQKAYTWDTLV